MKQWKFVLSVGSYKALKLDSVFLYTLYMNNSCARAYNIFASMFFPETSCKENM